MMNHTLPILHVILVAICASTHLVAARRNGIYRGSEGIWKSSDGLPRRELPEASIDHSNRLLKASEKKEKENSLPDVDRGSRQGDDNRSSSKSTGEKQKSSPTESSSEKDRRKNSASEVGLTSRQGDKRKTTEAPTMAPTRAPTKFPTLSPTRARKEPKQSPTPPPTISPSRAPVPPPTRNPSRAPSRAPISPPTRTPSITPTRAPASPPTRTPTNTPIVVPTFHPTLFDSKVSAEIESDSQTLTSPEIVQDPNPGSESSNARTEVPTSSFTTVIPAPDPSMPPEVHSNISTEIEPVSNPVDIPTTEQAPEPVQSVDSTESQASSFTTLFPVSDSGTIPEDDSDLSTEFEAVSPTNEQPLDLDQSVDSTESPTSSFTTLFPVSDSGTIPEDDSDLSTEFEALSPTNEQPLDLDQSVDSTESPTSSFTTLFPVSNPSMTPELDSDLSPEIEPVLKPVAPPTNNQASEPMQASTLKPSTNRASDPTMSPSIVSTTGAGDYSSTMGPTMPLTDIEFDETKFVAGDKLKRITFLMTISEPTEIANEEKLEIYFKEFIERVLDMSGNEDWYPFHVKSVDNITIDLIPMFTLQGAQKERSVGQGFPVTLIINGLVFVHSSGQQNQDTIDINNKVPQLTFHDFFEHSLLLYLTFWGVDNLQEVMTKDGGLKNPVIHSVFVGMKQLIRFDNDSLHKDNHDSSAATGRVNTKSESSERISKKNFLSFITILGGIIW
eukprot:CAMPEP_0197197654 /NCGR_PEP_ID=MMETSP1423-20130617/32973_1 /TAXON_ID=476441 /ORGANISM="Pseudo-nitzschia heimii, Strain UNC1101" /LENGTH=726 /DNA_ID=CAMNT_0042651479 /DNA_START=8 /DNA_END=2185 /DNA_ORIENTATION=-